MYRFLRFWGRDRSPWIFHCAGSTSLTPALFKGQLYFPFHLCMIRQSRLTPPIVTPVDLLHKASLSTCWSYLNLSAQNYPHLLDQAASTGPLALRTGQRVALGTPFSHRIRGWGVCANTTWRELCFRTPIPRAPPLSPGVVLTHSAQCGRRSAAASQNSPLTWEPARDCQYAKVPRFHSSFSSGSDSASATGAHYPLPTQPEEEVLGHGGRSHHRLRPAADERSPTGPLACWLVSWRGAPRPLAPRLLVLQRGSISHVATHADSSTPHFWGERWERGYSAEQREAGRR